MSFWNIVCHALQHNDAPIHYGVDRFRVEAYPHLEPLVTTHGWNSEPQPATSSAESNIEPQNVEGWNRFAQSK